MSLTLNLPDGMSEIVYKILPEPKSLVYGEGEYLLKKPLSAKFQQEIAAAWHDFPHAAERTLRENGLKVGFFEVPNLAARAYSIKVTENGILISAGGREGLCHAFQTLLRILEHVTDRLRCMEISDEPSTPWRAFHLDLSLYNYRMEYLRTLLLKLAALKYNAVVIDYRGMFPYETRYVKSFFSYTRDELSHMIAFAKRLGIMVIPLLPVLRQVDFVWDLEPYIWLSDLQEQCDETLAKVRTDLPEAVKLMKDLTADLAAAHTAPFVFLDFAGREEESSFCQELSDSQRSYALELCEVLKEHGKLPMTWAEILDERLLEKWPQGGVAVVRNGLDTEQAEKLRKAGLEVWNSYAAVAFPATEVSMRLKTRLKALLTIAEEKPQQGALVTAYMSHGLCQLNDRPRAPQLMHGTLRMPLVMAWEAVYFSASLLWNHASSPEALREAWPWYYFGTDNEKVREFTQFLENHAAAKADDYPQSSKALMKMADTLKKTFQNDVLDLVFFYARYQLYNRYIDQQFSRRKEIFHADQVITATKDMHKFWLAAMEDKLPLETVGLMQRHLFGYVEDLVRRAMRR